MERCWSASLVILVPFIFLNQALSEEIQSQPLKKLPEKIIQIPANCQKIERLERSEKVTVLAPESEADLVLISKSRRRIYLMQGDRLIRSYQAAFGFGYEDGPKAQENDGKTPEGEYEIESKNPKSKFHLGLKISYPNKADEDFAKDNGVKAGDFIMIHGFPEETANGLTPDEVKTVHPNMDWTEGCIAVTDHEIEEIYARVGVGTKVEICPLESANSLF